MDRRGVDVDAGRAESAVVRAASHGHLEVVKWLIQRGLGRGSTRAIHAAAVSGHLEVAKYLHTQGFIGCDQDTLEEAAKDGHLTVVQWLWTQFHGDPEADLLNMRDDNGIVSWGPPLGAEMAAAARNGHLEVIQYLHTIALTLVGRKRKRSGSSQFPCKIEMDFVAMDAARNGHLDVVQWVCTHTTVNSTKNAMASAASRGHFPVVKWLHENIQHEDFQTVVLDKAAFCGDLPLLKWLHTNRLNERWSNFAIDNAARCGHLHVLRWLLDHEPLYKDNGFSTSMGALNLALKGNHFDAVLFVHYEFEKWSSNPMVLNGGPYNEHIEAWAQEELGHV